MLSEDYYKHFFHFVLLAVLISICYSNTLNGEWHFDDIPNIVENRNIYLDNFSWEELGKSYHGPLSRPIAYFSFAINYYFSGLDTTGYHAFNITIHLINSFIIYLVCLNTLIFYQKKNPDSGFVSFSKQDVALLAAVLWALHPIQTQGVTYIVQRMTSMACMFYMVAMYCYLKLRQSHGKKEKFIYGILVVFFWIAGIFTKEHVILFPFVLIVYELAFLTLFDQKVKNILIGAAAATLLIAALTYILIGGEIVNIIVDPYEVRPFTLWQRLITEPIVLLRYLFLILCPLENFLVVESDLVASKGLLQPSLTLVANLGVTLAILLSSFYLRRFPVLCFSILFFFISHLVESSFLGLELYFEHRNYLPSVFLYFALAYYSLKLCDYYARQSKRALLWLLLITLTVVLVSEGNATFLRNGTWNTKMGLLADTIEKSPQNIRARVSLGAAYIRQKQYIEAQFHLSLAEKLYYENPERSQKNWVALLYYNQGVLAIRQSEEDKAIALLRKSLEFSPTATGWNSYLNLGVLYFNAGDLANAEFMLKKALHYGKGLPDIYNALGRVLYAQGRLNESVKVLRDGIEKGETVELKLNLVAALIGKGSVKQAKLELLSIPYNEKDSVYLLYRAVLFPDDEELKNSIRKVANNIHTATLKYDNWLHKALENKYIGIIYPDILPLVRRLNQEYLNVLMEAKEDIVAEMEPSLSCYEQAVKVR